MQLYIKIKFIFETCGKQNAKQSEIVFLTRPSAATTMILCAPLSVPYLCFGIVCMMSSAAAEWRKFTNRNTNVKEGNKEQVMVGKR